MKGEDQNRLMRELFEDEQQARLRRESLARGVETLRQVRRRRTLLRATVYTALPLLALLLFVFRPPTPHPPQTKQALSSPVVGVPGDGLKPAQSPGGIALLTDEELFALFPGRSMALVGESGNQKLLFLGSAQAR